MQSSSSMEVFDSPQALAIPDVLQ